MKRAMLCVAICGLMALGAITLALLLPGEKESCKDQGDTKAYMARLPGEGHKTERCIFVRRFGDPSWVPELGDPLLVSGGVKGRPGKEQQLTWVRTECRKLAKQLNQRC